MEFTRDYAMYATIFGFFGMIWFGWAQENPPKSWRAWLGIGSVLSVVTMVAGIYLAATNWGAASTLTRETSIAFGIVFWTEFILAGIGAWILAAKHKKQYIPAWIAFVVGVHFLPLAWIFQDWWLYLLTSLTTTMAIVAVIVAKKTGIAISALTGTLMGCVLLIFALRGLYLYFW
jgi:hypothetical protein